MMSRPTLGDFLDPSRAVVPLPGETLPNAVTALVERLDASGILIDPDKLTRRIEEARAEDMLTLGDRAFLLHFRTDAARELAVAIGTSPVPLCLTDAGAEGPCTRIVLLVVTPPRQAAPYLQVLGALGRLLQGEEAVSAVLAQPTPEALAALPLLREFVLPEQLAVRDLMSEHPRTTTPDTPLRDAARQMIRAGVSALPVVDGDRRLLGLLSERELLRHLSSTLRPVPGGGAHRPPGPTSAPSSVRDAMTRQVLCVAPDQPLAEVATLMGQRDINQVPVLAGGRLVGFLTRGDIVRKLIDS